MKRNIPREMSNSSGKFALTLRPRDGRYRGTPTNPVTDVLRLDVRYDSRIENDCFILFPSDKGPKVSVSKTGRRKIQIPMAHLIPFFKERLGCDKFRLYGYQDGDNAVFPLSKAVRI